MELCEMIFNRLVEDSGLATVLAQFNERPAIFYQHPPSSDNVKWGLEQYPRIDYMIDMQENPARNTSGIMYINVWCDAETGTEPEAIESRVRQLLHACFAQADDNTYCLAWVRSDAFTASNEKEQNNRTFGVTLVFDLMACPPQQTFYPDPITAMNVWTKSVIPTATVIGMDSISGWLVPTRNNPAVYWRITAQSVKQKHFAYTWLNISMEGHVYARNAYDRLYNLARLNTAHALAGHIPMEDGSPLFLKDFSVKPHFNYLSQGQIQVNGTFGILQPQQHLENHATGKMLRRVNIPRQIIDADGIEAVIDGDTTRPYVFPYEMPNEDSPV